MNAINLIEPGSFAEACYNQNSIADMKAALHAPADPVDMEAWGLTDDEYYAQIKFALAAKHETPNDPPTPASTTRARNASGRC